jgi:hypothetical protein
MIMQNTCDAVACRLFDSRELTQVRAIGLDSSNPLKCSVHYEASERRLVVSASDDAPTYIDEVVKKQYDVLFKTGPAAALFSRLLRMQMRQLLHVSDGPKIFVYVVPSCIRRSIYWSDVLFYEFSRILGNRLISTCFDGSWSATHIPD